MSSKRKCGPFPFVLLLKDMTDDAVDARLDFVFIKRHTGGDTGHTCWGGLSLLFSSFLLSLHTVSSCFDCRAMSQHFYQCTLPCDPSGQIAIEVAVTFLWKAHKWAVWRFHHRISYYTNVKGFHRTPENLSFHLFSRFLMMFSPTTFGSLKSESSIQAASRMLLSLTVTQTVRPPLICQDCLWPGSNQSQLSGVQTQTAPLCLTYSLPLTPSVAFFFPLVIFYLLLNIAANHSTTVVTVGWVQKDYYTRKQKYNTQVSQNWTFSSSWLVASYPVHDYSCPPFQNQNFIVLSRPLTLGAVLSRARSLDKDMQCETGHRQRINKTPCKMPERTWPRAGTGKCLCCVCAHGYWRLDGPVLSVSHKPHVMCTLRHSAYPLTFIPTPTWLQCYFVTWLGVFLSLSGLTVYLPALLESA